VRPNRGRSFYQCILLRKGNIQKARYSSGIGGRVTGRYSGRIAPPVRRLALFVVRERTRGTGIVERETLRLTQGLPKAYDSPKQGLQTVTAE